MVSRRKRNKQARTQGLTPAELRMVELLEELVQEVKWLQVLGWSNQFLLQEKLELSQDERDRVLEAAARAVDADGRTRDWIAEVGRLKGEVVRAGRAVADALGERGRAGVDPGDAAPVEGVPAEGQATQGGAAPGGTEGPDPATPPLHGVDPQTGSLAPGDLDFLGDLPELPELDPWDPDPSGGAARADRPAPGAVRGGSRSRRSGGNAG